MNPRNLLIAALGFAAASAAAVTIVTIGDSTVSYYKDSLYPKAGWGQELPHYFKPGSVNVINRAMGGRSSRSFVELGQWASTVPDLKPGSWLFIQFAHNDRDPKVERFTDTTQYKTYLAMYIDSARKLGVHPVLVTAMNMNTWTGTKVREVFTEGALNYWAAMKHVGAAKRVPVLDLGHQSTLLMDTLGQAYMAKFHFMGLDTGEYQNYPTGSTDGTHFQEEGAQENCRLITDEIARQASDSVLAPLAALLAKRYGSTVTSNLAAGGTVTHSRRFPPGATATIKVKVATGKTFRYWANSATGDSLTNAPRFSYLQDTVAHAYTAVFAGAPFTALLPNAPAKASPKLSRVSVHGTHWTIAWSGQATSLRVFDLRGQALATIAVSDLIGETQFTLASGMAGVRVVQLQTGNHVLDSRTIIP